MFVRRCKDTKLGIYKCDTCGKIFKRVYRRSVKINKYCSRSCINQGRKHTVDTKRKISEKTRGQLNGFFGQKHDENTRMVMGEKSKIGLASRSDEEKRDWKEKISQSSSGMNNGFFGQKHDEETRQRMSKSRARGIAEGRIQSGPRGIQGKYTSSKTSKIERFDSFYELFYMWILDNDDEVISWTKKHGIQISYEFDGNFKNYVPDFRVERLETILLEEIKGYENEAKLKAKLEALQNYCLESSIHCRVLYVNDLNKLANKHYNCTVQTLRKQWKKQIHEKEFVSRVAADLSARILCLN